MELNICYLYPDVLNLYGDGGNIICLQRRLQWRGIKSNVTRAGIGDKVSLADFDLMFIGGGQDFEQEVLLEDLHRGKASEILSAVEDGKTFLTICGGYQMMGNYYETHEGVRCDFIGAVDLYTVGSPVRMIGNYKWDLKTTAERPISATECLLWGLWKRDTETTEKTARKACGIKTYSVPTAMARCFPKIRNSVITS